MNFLSLQKEIVNLFPKYIQKRLPKEMAVVSISVRESSALNAQYRKKKTATNVLSFRYDTDYGEILVCPSIIRREAREQGHTYDYQMTWMVLHGMLHLAELHHEESKKIAKKTERIEQNVLDTLFD